MVTWAGAGHDAGRRRWLCVGVSRAAMQAAEVTVGDDVEVQLERFANPPA